MKDEPLDGHRGKVAIGDNITKQQQSSTEIGKTPTGQVPAAAAASSSDVSSPTTAGQGSTNFDDDYNEWELGIGDLIIDLDADIEKNNEKNSSGTGGGSHQQNGGLASGIVGGGSGCLPPGPGGASANSNSSQQGSPSTGLSCSLSGQVTLSASGAIMSNSKSSRIASASSGGGNVNSGANATGGGGSGNSGNSASSTGGGCIPAGGGTAATSATTVEHQATVDKGLKMKIKRKNVGSKSSEAKHEIVQSDTTSKLGASSSGSHHQNVEVAAGATPSITLPTTSSTVSAVAVVSTNAVTPETKSKHSSGKGRSGSHRDKKEKSRDKDKNKNVPATSEMNGIGGSNPSNNISSTSVTPALKIASVNLSSLTNSSGALTCLSTTNMSGSSSQSSTTGIVISGATTASVVPSAAATNHQDQSGQGGSTSSAASVTGSTAGVTNCGGATGSGTGPPAIVANGPTPTNVSSIPNLTVKLETKYGSPNASTNAPCSPANTSVISKIDELPKSPPVKRVKVERVDRVDGVCSPIPPEMQDTGTCTSIGTVTEPECLGPCEPGTSVLLEGIVWQETEGAGVLVVNVTWRGKTYVGTLLDCTRHDWAPPRLCESPISDMDAKTVKGRGKRGRGSAAAATGDNNFAETRTAVQSKLRNGKGRRNGANAGFTVPTSPARGGGTTVAESAGKRKGRPADLDLSPSSSSVGDAKGSKRSRTQSRNTPTPSGNSTGNSVDFSQPSSPMLIECPEPNCSKKYKHINGLRYHQTHAHSGNQETSAATAAATAAAIAAAAASVVAATPAKIAIEEPSIPMEEGAKEVTNTSETEENQQEQAPSASSSQASAALQQQQSSPAGQTSTPSLGSPKATTTNVGVVGTNAPLRNVPASHSTENGTAVVLGSNCVASASAVDSFPMNSDLSTLASVAISDSANMKSNLCFPPAVPSASQTLPTPASTPNSAIENKSSATSKLGSSTQSHAKQEMATPSHPPVSSSGTVIQPPASSMVIVSSANTMLTQTPSVTVSIPTSHVMSFSGQMATSINNGVTLVTNSQTATAGNPHPMSSLPASGGYSNPAVAPDTAFSATASAPTLSSSTPLASNQTPSLPVSLDKTKIKQEKSERYKTQKVSPGTPLSSNIGVRPIPPATSALPGTTPAQSVVVPSNIPSSHLGHVQTGSGPLMPGSLKPIQPKPTILGDPTSGGPTLENLKKEKSKHKKKCKDKDKKLGLSTSSNGKIPGHGLNQGEGERMDTLSYHMAETLQTSSREGIGNSPAASGGSQQSAVPSLCSLGAGPPSARSLDLSIDPNTPESTMNENVQSPAYSDISDANDTAPVLESEVVVSEKEKDDKTLKASSEAAPSPSGNIPSYGMYSYYGQPPYLIPSVPPQNTSPSAEKMASDNPGSKKSETERNKDPSKMAWGGIDMSIDNRVGATPEQQEQPQPNNSSGSSSSKKSSSRVEDLSSSSVPAPVVPSNTGLPEYQQPSIRQSPLQQVQQPSLQQNYSYPYGYMQGFPYSMDPSFHMHMLTNDPHYKQQHERLLHEQERMYKEQHHHQQQAHHQQQMQQHHQSERRSSGSHSSTPKEDISDRNIESRGLGRHSDLKRSSPSTSSHHYSNSRERESRESRESQSGGSGLHMSNHIKRETPPSNLTSPSPSSATAAASLKEKQSENHQILKENIELKSQMDSGKAKYSHYDAVLMEQRQREDLRRYYLMQEQMMEPENAIQGSLYHPSQHGPSSRKEENSHYPSMQPVGKQTSVIESNRGAPPCISPHKSEHHSKNMHGSSVSNSKGSVNNSAFRDSHHSKEHSSSREKKESSSNSSKNDSHHDVSSKEDKIIKSEKSSKSSSHSEGQKPTMETTGPPPPPTNSYAYLHPSYLQPPPHFAHMPFDPTHPMYRGGLNPILMSAAAGPAAAYGGSPYLHPQLRYHVPHPQPPQGPCDLPPPHSQPPVAATDPHHHHMSQKMHPGPPAGSGPPGAPKALDLLHQVSQHYTTHKIHELQERALMSPSTTPNSVGGGGGGSTNSSNPTPTSTPTSGSSGNGPNTGSTGPSHGNSKSVNSEQNMPSSKQDPGATGDRSRSPPPQRHLHTHHHTHVGVGYPLYDPYAVNPQHWKQAQAQSSDSKSANCGSNRGLKPPFRTKITDDPFHPRAT